MKKNKFILAGLIFSIFARVGIFADDLLTAELMSELKTNGSIRKIYEDQENVELSLYPNTDFCKATLNSWVLKDKKPKIVSENLFYITKEQLKKNSANPEKADTSLEGVSKVVRSISKMKGMQYYSNSDKKWETLYKKAYVCESVKNKKKVLPDVTDGSADGLSLYCFLEDNSFGDSVYEVNYKQSDKELAFNLLSVADWKFGFITTLEAKHLVIDMVIIDNDDSYIVYALLQTKYKSFPFLGEKILDSLTSRIDAIYNWFTLQF